MLHRPRAKTATGLEPFWQRQRRCLHSHSTRRSTVTPARRPYGTGCILGQRSPSPGCALTAKATPREACLLGKFLQYDPAQFEFRFCQRCLNAKTTPNTPPMAQATSRALGRVAQPCACGPVVCRLVRCQQSPRRCGPNRRFARWPSACIMKKGHCQGQVLSKWF